jgi:hypothetical protein
MYLIVKYGLTFLIRKGKHYSLKVRSAFLLDILKMSNVTDFFNSILEIIIRRDVKFDENLLSHDPNLTCVPSSMFVPSSLPNFFVSDHILVYSLDDDNEDEIHLCLLTFLQLSPLNMNLH